MAFGIKQEANPAKAESVIEIVPTRESASRSTMLKLRARWVPAIYCSAMVGRPNSS